MNYPESPYQTPKNNMSAVPPEFVASVTTSIPKVFGIINICYAGIGVLGAVISMGSFFVMKALFTAVASEAEVVGALSETYNTMAVYTFIDGGLRVGLGLMLLIAGIGLLKRRGWGQKLSIIWAVLRIVAGVVMVVVTFGAGAELQEAVAQITSDKPGAIDQRGLGSGLQGIGSVFSVIMVSIYPVVVIVFLNKKVVKDFLR